MYNIYIYIYIYIYKYIYYTYILYIYIHTYTLYIYNIHTTKNGQDSKKHCTTSISPATSVINEFKNPANVLQQIIFVTQMTLQTESLKTFKNQLQHLSFYWHSLKFYKDLFFVCAILLQNIIESPKEEGTGNMFIWPVK